MPANTARWIARGPHPAAKYNALLLREATAPANKKARYGNSQPQGIHFVMFFHPLAAQPKAETHGKLLGHGEPADHGEVLPAFPQIYVEERPCKHCSQKV